MSEILKNKKVWITGASSGIGQATALKLADAGCEIILSARRLERLEMLKNKIIENGGKATIKLVDVSIRGDMEKLGLELAELGGVDILINNAGIMPLSSMVEGRVDEWEKTIDTNLKGVLYAINAVLSGMKAKKSGHIVNISSVVSRVTFATAGVYSATKHGVRALSDVLRKEGLRYGVRVTDIQPGAVATELPFSIQNQKIRDAMIADDSPYGQNMPNLQPEDIANAIFYALIQPNHVDVSEILIRPTYQDL